MPEIFKLSEVNDILKISKDFTDAFFESNYNKFLVNAHQYKTIDIDFRKAKWYDLWALIQLLILLSKDDFVKKTRKILLISPDSVPRYLPDFDKKIERIIKALTFLVNSEFLNHAVKMGVELFLQINPSGNFEKVEIDKIIKIINRISEKPLIAFETNFIIPITKLSDLNLDEKRDELFQRSKELFQDYYNEPIVQEAGLGDCLISELVQNVYTHGKGKGYIALRVLPGLKKYKRDGADEKYEDAKRIKKNYRLCDYREFFNYHIEEPFFELIVVDFGEGISKTILEDPRLYASEKLKNDILAEQDINKRRHKLIRYALENTSSRFSKEERIKNDYSDFTGLAAIQYVLYEHEGVFLVREKNTRHYFDPSNNIEGKYFENVFLEDYETKRKFPNLNGVTITILIPIKRHSFRKIGHLPKYEILNKIIFETFEYNEIIIYHVKDARCFYHSYLNTKYGKSWEEIISDISEIKKTKAILIDIRFASLDKNTLWPKLMHIRKICFEKKTPIFLCGVNHRSAWRIEEYLNLERQNEKNINEWILLAFGDDYQIYCFCFLNKSYIPKDYISDKISEFFQDKSIELNFKEKSLLYTSHYTEKNEKGELIFVTSFSYLANYFSKAQGKLLEKRIIKTNAWVTAKVKLSNGEKLNNYLCIHSITQMRDLHLDLLRIIRLYAFRYKFDFVISVGIVYNEFAKIISKDIPFIEGTSLIFKDVGYYVYYDYFSFDHGESSNKVIKSNSNVLILVDGIRKGDHVLEALEHVRDCDAHVIAIISILDLSEKEELSILDLSEREGLNHFEKIPIQCCLKIPIRTLENVEENDIEYIESPFSHTLSKLTDIFNNDWKVILRKKQAYRYLEENGLILKGHSIFINQHFARTISLPYLLNSSTSFNMELIKTTLELIRETEIDCIIFPDHSSIHNLVSQLEKRAKGIEFKTVMCKFAVWPDRTVGYKLDREGEERLKSAKRIMILEDEIYTGSSIKNILILIFSTLREKLEKIIVFTIINSMKAYESTSIVKLIQELFHINNKYEKKEKIISFYAFMQFSLCSYWNKDSCPICQLIRDFNRSLTLRFGFLEEKYAEERIKQLEPHIMDQDFFARRKMTPVIKIKNFTSEISGAVTITSQEGLEIYCEEKYIEGDIAWLINRIDKYRSSIFIQEKDVILTIIEILSRDLSIIRRLRLQKQWFDNLRTLLTQKIIYKNYLARFMEILAIWPLHCLYKIWVDLIKILFEENYEHLIDCYPGAQFLLFEIDNRPNHKFKSLLLNDFESRIQLLLKGTLPNDEEGRTKCQLFMCLKRSAFGNRPENKSISALISDMIYILAYYSPEKINHMIFRKCLNLLCLAKEEYKSEYRIVSQLASQLWYILESLTQQDPNALVIRHLPEYQKLGVQIEFLQNIYSYKNSLAEKLKNINQSANIIKMILFGDNMKGHFRAVLEEYIDKYKCTFSKMMKPFEEKKFILKYSGSFNKSDFNNIFTVIDESSMEDVFGELAINLERAREKYSWNNLSNQKSLVYEIDIITNESMDKIELSIKNECIMEDYENIKKGLVGKGIGRMKTKLNWLGHTFDINYDGKYLEQTLGLRRIYI